MNIIDEYLKSILNESYTSSTIKRGRQQKLKSTAGRIGVSLAKKKDDPLYKKMIFHKHMYMKYKEELQKKYKSKANTLARQRASNY